MNNKRFRLKMPGAVIRGHGLRLRGVEVGDDGVDPATGLLHTEELIRAALNLTPDAEILRIFEVSAEKLADGTLLREMRFFDGIVDRVSVAMDEDNRVEVALFSYASGSLRQYSLEQLVSLSDIAQQALKLAEDLRVENDRLSKLLAERSPA